jgi:hypothetical protein
VLHGDADQSFHVTKLPWPKNNYPFTPADAPIEITATARQIPQWTLDQYELCGILPASPVASDFHEQTISLIPMGATRLRISAFPVIGTSN